MRPQTPIRTIINNIYGSVAELQQSRKNSQILVLKKELKKKAPPRNHTRASSAMQSFVCDNLQQLKKMSTVEGRKEE